MANYDALGGIGSGMSKLAEMMYGSQMQQQSSSDDLLKLLVGLKLQALFNAQDPWKAKAAELGQGQLGLATELGRGTLGVAQSGEERLRQEQEWQHGAAARERQQFLDNVAAGAERVMGGSQTQQGIQNTYRDAALQRQANALETAQQSSAAGKMELPRMIEDFMYGPVGQRIMSKVLPRRLQDLFAKGVQSPTERRSREEAMKEATVASDTARTAIARSEGARLSPQIQDIIRTGGPRGYAETQYARGDLKGIGMDPGQMAGLSPSSMADIPTLLSSPAVQAMIAPFIKQYPNLTPEEILQIILEEYQGGSTVPQAEASPSPSK